MVDQKGFEIFAQLNYSNPNGASQQKLHQGATAGNKSGKRDLKHFHLPKQVRKKNASKPFYKL